MAERYRSKDGRRETEEVLGTRPEDLPEAPGQTSRSGGEIARTVGTRDEIKRTEETPAGVTRVQKRHDLKDAHDGDKGGNP